jgi:hypothetical protein
MTKEEILKLLAALGVKLGEGGMAEDDAVKLVIDQFDASNRGLIAKRDELLAEVTGLKKKGADMEAAGNETAKKIADLEAQIKKANPEEYKKYYEGLANELEAKHKTEIGSVQADLDKYRNSHYERIRSDSIEEAVKNYKFMDGLKGGFIALAMLKNQFKPTELDGGKVVFTNQDNKTIEAVLHELSLSDEGKAYLKNGNQGGGSSGGTTPGGGSGGVGGGLSMPRAEFNALGDIARMEFMNKGGVVTNQA